MEAGSVPSAPSKEGGIGDPVAVVLWQRKSESKTKLWTCKASCF